MALGGGDDAVELLERGEDQVPRGAEQAAQAVCDVEERLERLHRVRVRGRLRVRVRVRVRVRGKVTCAAQLMAQQQQVGQRVLEELLVPD